MDRLKNITGSDKPAYAGASDGNDGKSTSRWRKDFKGLDQVAGWMGKSSSSSSPADTYTRPITDLKDPASFGPPPKHYAVEGRKPIPLSPSSSQAGSSERGSVQRNVSLPPSQQITVGRGVGLPPPIPPRLPAREGSFPKPREVTDEDVRKTGGLNTTALGRLGNAGISVAGFGISSSQPSDRPRVNPVASKFGQLSSSDSEQSAGGTTFAEKRAAIQTANALSKDPSQVSLSDARTATRTAQNFQRRHGEQVAAGISTAQSINDKMVSPRSQSINPSLPLQSSAPNSPSLSSSADMGKKKPPPPPPKKKPSLIVNSSPPIPPRHPKS